MRRYVSALSLALVFAFTACGDEGGGTAESSGRDKPKPTLIESAHKTCATNPRARQVMTVEDRGNTLVIDGGGQVGFCVLRAMDAPGSTISKVEGTSALMGRQSDEFGGYEVTWSYHPDSGLDMIVETVKG